MKFPRPSFSIPGYLHRWHLLPRNRWWNLYLHKFVGPDPLPWLHNHPGTSISIMLRGGYDEEFQSDISSPVEVRSLGFPNLSWRSIQVSFSWRGRSSFHRINKLYRQPVWTLWLHSRSEESWGFLINGKLYPAERVLDPHGIKGVAFDFVHLCLTMSELEERAGIADKMPSTDACVKKLHEHYPSVPLPALYHLVQTLLDKELAQ